MKQQYAAAHRQIVTVFQQSVAYNQLARQCRRIMAGDELQM